MNPPLTGPESARDSFLEFTPTVYESNLRSLLESIEESGAKPLLLTLPTVVRMEMTEQELRDAGVFFPYYPSAYAVGDFLQLVAVYNGVIRRVAEEKNIEIVDIATAFSEFDEVDKYFYDTMHLSSNGRGIAAELISDHISDRALLPGTESDD
jgi:lysophospholipase L1-like esterase